VARELNIEIAPSGKKIGKRENSELQQNFMYFCIESGKPANHPLYYRQWF